LRAMWDGARAVLPPVALPKVTPLPSVAEEGPPGDKVVVLQEMWHAETVLNILLLKLKAFAVLPSQLQTLTQEITSSLTSDLVALLKNGLSERIHLGRLLLDDHTDMTDRLRPLIQGLVRTRNLKESVVVWREAVLEEVHGIVQQVRLLTVVLLGE
jgi:vacuolar protein sorting-associated protein 54